MRAAVVGLGSMGKRRIRLILKWNTKIEIIGVDLNKDRRREAEELFGILTYEKLEDALAETDVVFVSTAPLSHSNIISKCLDAGVDVFTELNLVTDGYDANIKKAEEKKCVLFLSSTFLYRDEIKYIHQEVSRQTRHMNYTYHTGQYLPDWHTWENIRDFFVGDSRTNGCREIFAIELPWLVAVFGEIKEVQVLKSKNTELSIDYADNYMVLIQHETGHKGMLAVDVVSRKAVRNLEVYGEQIYLSWDGTPAGLRKLDITAKKEQEIELYREVDHQEGYSSSIVENAYLNEIAAFFDMVENRNTVNEIYDFRKDKVILEWIDKIEG